jgi:hypothetical protein
MLHQRRSRLLEVDERLAPGKVVSIVLLYVRGRGCCGWTWPKLSMRHASIPTKIFRKGQPTLRGEAAHRRNSASPIPVRIRCVTATQPCRSCSHHGKQEWLLYDDRRYGTSTKCHAQRYHWTMAAACCTFGSAHRNSLWEPAFSGGRLSRQEFLIERGNLPSISNRYLQSLQ